MEELFEQAISFLEDFDLKSLNVEQQHNLLEASSRMKYAAKKYGEIISKNKILAEISSNEQRSNPLFKTLLEKLPNNDPIKIFFENKPEPIDHSSAKDISNLSKDISNLSKDIEKNIEFINLNYETEAYYNNLWRAKERLENLPNFKGFNPRGVCIARNQLMEHVERPKSKAYLYNFTVSLHNGPQIRSGKPANAKATDDPGFPLNVKEFLLEIIAIML